LNVTAVYCRDPAQYITPTYLDKRDIQTGSMQNLEQQP